MFTVKIHRLGYLLICLWLTIITCQGQDILDETKAYYCHFTDQPITIDGYLDSTWTIAPWLSDFEDIRGGTHEKPLQQTRVKLLWNKTHLYIYAELEEEHIWGTLTDRDAIIYHDNDFEVFLDPDMDGHRYYELEINALNTVMDLFMSLPYYIAKGRRKYLLNWQMKELKTAVHINGSLNNSKDIDTSWTVEIAIPFKSLELDKRPKAGDTWHLNFSRVQWPTKISQSGSYQKIKGQREYNWVWSPTGVIDIHRPEKWAYLHFIDDEIKEPLFLEDNLRKRLYRCYHYLRQNVTKKPNPATCKECSDIQVTMHHTSFTCSLPSEKYPSKRYYITEEGRILLH